MLQLRDFHTLVGETLMYCQTIEFDLKRIYAGLQDGDINKNFTHIRNKSLGFVLGELQEYDRGSRRPYFSEGDYALLDGIKNIRNYWVHKGHIEFLYALGDEWQVGLEKQYDRLYKEYQKLRGLAEEIQEVRINVQKRRARGNK